MSSFRVYAGPLLTVVGLLGAASALLTRPLGVALALACAVALAIRRDWLPAVALAGVKTLVLVTLLMLGAPTSVEIGEVARNG